MAPTSRERVVHEANAASIVPDAFAAYLRTQLRTRNLTARALARKSGVSHSTISRLLSGERVPSLATARRLHAGLGAPDPAGIFGAPLPPRRDPVRVVDEALRADPLLADGARRRIMGAYLRLRDAAVTTSGSKGSRPVDPASGPAPGIVARSAAAETHRW